MTEQKYSGQADAGGQAGPEAGSSMSPFLEAGFEAHGFSISHAIRFDESLRRARYLILFDLPVRRPVDRVRRQSRPTPLTIREQ